MDIKTLLKFDKIIPRTQARLLQGPAGIGKSSIVRLIAEQRSARLIDLRLSELEPADLVGLPYLEQVGDKKVTKFAEPHWWPTDPNEIVVLFLDEVDRCRSDMHAIAMQLTLDRRAGGRDLPPNVYVWAGANGEKFMTAAIDQALMNRFAVIEFTPTEEEWLIWASDNKDIHDSVVKFIRSDPNRLDTPDDLIGRPNVVVPSRRTWAALGLALKNLETDITEEENIMQYAAAFIGDEYAAAFSSWVKENYTVVNPDDIFSGDASPENLDILQIMFVAQEVATRFMEKTRTKDELYNCLKFYMDAGHEAFATLFEALPKEAAFKIYQFKDVDKYINDSRSVLETFVKAESA